MGDLIIHNVGHEITNKNRDKLMETGAIYWCDDCNGYHLTPDHKFILSEDEDGQSN